MIAIHRALISCWDKTGLDQLAAALHERGVEIVSSGGTARYLQERNIPVVKVADVTSYPEVLGGRVKTLHPLIHAPILAQRTPEHLADLKRLDAQPIDLVIVNLYPFVAEAARKQLPLDKAIEFIDIGGPTLLRAAAKNYQYVVSVHDPSRYGTLLSEMAAHDGRVSAAFSESCARAVFYYTSWYDGQVSAYFNRQADEGAFAARQGLFVERDDMLRYGENPHQQAAMYHPFGETPRGMAAIEQLWGKPLSYNNYLDVNAAYSMAIEFDDPAVIIVKHSNPCGAAVRGEGIDTAFEAALRGDPLSSFGGIVACNRTVNSAAAEQMSKIFFECIIAPDFDARALQLLQKKKNLRLLKLPAASMVKGGREIKTVNGGFLVQEVDAALPDPSAWQVVTDRQPTAGELQELAFGWTLIKHIKSNAILFTRDREVLGVGAGQMSRVDSVEIAAMKARAAGRDLSGTLMASDAFFPFRDGIDKAAAAGITVIIQPGGSIRDEEVIAAANEHGICMVFTGKRHFKH